MAYPWPGNVRELRNVIRTALAICDGGVIRRIDLPREIREADTLQAAPYQAELRTDLAAECPGSANPLQVAERAALLSVIEDCHGNMTRVAMQLGHEPQHPLPANQAARHTARTRRLDLRLASADRSSHPAGGDSSPPFQVPAPDHRAQDRRGGRRLAHRLHGDLKTPRNVSAI